MKEQFNTDPLWGFSASYCVPSGQRVFYSNVVRCKAENLHDAVLKQITDNPKRKYFGKLSIYNKMVIGERQ